MEMTPEEADREINERAMPVFRNFRYRESPYTLYRKGGPNEFSEFTRHPSRPEWAPQLTGGRGSGHLTGQYAFCSPQTGTIPIVGPVNPFFITAGKKWADVDPATDFARTARDVLRLAETLTGSDWIDELSGSKGMISTWSRSSPYWFIRGDQKYYVNFFWVRNLLEKHINDWDCSTDVLEELLWVSVLNWTDFQQVHPLNIFLSRCGFDGVMFGEYALEWGDTGEWGCLKFPPITAAGEVVGLVPLGLTRYMYLPS